MTDRSSKATERERAKLAGVDDHPADQQHDDPPAAKLAEIDPRRRAGTLKHLGGSHSDPVNIRIANDAKEATWMPDQECRSRACEEVGDIMAGINPGDVLEGMLAGQLVAANAAAMESFRRAMIPTNTMPGREMNLNQANKASRTFASLLEALNRHRGKGQQKVRVEHVHVYPGGQAVVGNVEHGGAGAHLKNERQPHARALGNQLQDGSKMCGQDQERGVVQQPCNAERPMPDARRQQPRRSHG